MMLVPIDENNSLNKKIELSLNIKTERKINTQKFFYFPLYSKSCLKIVYD
jgi:hypothetical protein